MEKSSKKRTKERKKRSKKKGSHKPIGGDVLLDFSLALGVKTPYTEHQGVQIVSLCCVG